MIPGYAFHKHSICLYGAVSTQRVGKSTSSVGKLMVRTASICLSWAGDPLLTSLGQ